MLLLLFCQEMWLTALFLYLFAKCATDYHRLFSILPNEITIFMSSSTEYPGFKHERCEDLWLTNDFSSISKKHEGPKANKMNKLPFSIYLC